MPSGLQYKILQTGNGKFHPTDFSYCIVHYRALFMNDTEFYSSYAKNSPLTFRFPDGLKSWIQVLPEMVEGDVWELYVPSELGEGNLGFPTDKISPGDAIIFQLELVKITAEKRPAHRCNLHTLQGCDDGEKALIGKFGDDVEKMSREIKRIKVLVEEKSMKDELRDFMAAKVVFLENLMKRRSHETSREHEL